MAHTNILLESGTNELEIVEFYLDEPNYRGYYGINVAKVVEIIRIPPIITMPNMRHPSVVGAFAFRTGRILPLIDLCIFLGIPHAEKGDPKIIITEFNQVMTAFLVSGVTRIYRLKWTDVEPPTAYMDKMTHNSFTGVVRLEDRVVFQLDLEAVVGELQPSLALHMATIEDVPPEERRYRVLHADDSGSVRKLMHSLLDSRGSFDLVQVCDGQEAWELLEATRNQAQQEGKHISQYFQGIISDIEMPRMDGLTLCRKVKEDAVLRQLPLAVFSSLVSVSSEHKGNSVGADAQFAKPDLQTLHDRLKELIESRLPSWPPIPFGA